MTREMLRKLAEAERLLKEVHTDLQTLNREYAGLEDSMSYCKKAWNATRRTAKELRGFMIP